MNIPTGGLAVVTGAAGGLGSSFANQLAERGYRLLLVDKREHQLKQVCDSIHSRHGVSAMPCIADLCNRDEVEQLAQRLQQTADLELLVNNAGFGTLDYFVDTDVKCVLDMAHVHVVAPMLFTRAVLPGMLERNRGAIINVSSLSAWFQSAGNVHYGSTKSFLTVFSMSLQQELLGTNVRVQALCPGFVRTEFHDTNAMKGFKMQYASAGRMWMSADEVVRCSLQRLSGKQVVVIPGFGYSIVGRLAQMPVLRPLIQRLVRVPRLPASTAQVSQVCQAPVLAMQESTEILANSS